MQTTIHTSKASKRITVHVAAESKTSAYDIAAEALDNEGLVPESLQGILGPVEESPKGTTHVVSFFI